MATSHCVHFEGNSAFSKRVHFLIHGVHHKWPHDKLRLVFPPGASIPLHLHNCEESVLLLEGRATAEIDGVKHEVEAGEVSFIPAGIAHRFINASASEEMSIYWTYASLDATRTIVATGETRRIEDEHRGPLAADPRA